MTALSWWVRGALWVSVYLAAVLTPLVLLLLVRHPEGGGFWWDVAVGFGFAGLVMMGVQFLLTARFRRATDPFGIDVVYYFHRYLAYIALAIIVAHPVILVWVNPALLPYLNPLHAPWEMTTGTLSVVLLLVLVVASVIRKPLGVSYELWRVTHLLLAVGAVGAGFAHMVGIGHYSSAAPLRVLWAGIGLSIVLVVLHVRVLRPWRLLRRPFRVTQVRKESGDSWTLTLAPEGHAGFSFEPGQFVWLSLGHSPFAMREHPFSISSSPRPDGALDLTIKELGDFTRTIGATPPEAPAWVDGPYGAFSIDRRPDAPGYVFVGGGIGIAPIVGMLRTLADRGDRRPLLLFTAHSRWDRIPLRDEVTALADRLDLRVVHVLEDPPAGWTGASGWIDREILDRHLPTDRDGLEYYLCGPIPMLRAVSDLLHRAGVPDRNVHTEIFDLV